MRLLALALLAACGPKTAPKAAADAAPTSLAFAPDAPRICVPGDPAARGAVEALVAGDGEAAWAVLGPLTESPETADACLLQAAAWTALRTGRTGQGGMLAKLAATAGPELVPAQMLWGFWQTTNRDPEGAAKTFRGVLALQPDHPLANGALGAWELSRGDALLAVPRLEIAQRAGLPVGPLLTGAYFGAQMLPEYVRAASASGWPMGDAGALGQSDDPLAAYRSLLGVGPTDGLVVDLETSLGTLTCQLFWQDAPVTVANFVGLARGTQPYRDPRTGAAGSGPYYDGTVLHRVIPEFMVQMGDPTGTGSGDPGYRFPDEIAPQHRFDKPGVLAMANGGPNTNGAQFFVTEVPTPHLDGHHTIFGQCDDAAVEVAKQIARVPVGDMDKPVQDIILNKVTVRGE